MFERWCDRDTNLPVTGLSADSFPVVAWVIELKVMRYRFSVPGLLAGEIVRELSSSLSVDVVV